MNNIAGDFVAYLTDLGYGILGVDIFIGGVPIDAPDIAWWVLAAGGASEPKNSTGERLKNYTVNVFYRNKDSKVVYELLQALEEEINSKECTQLDHYETVEMEAIQFPTDQDLDEDDRTVGTIQVKITVYQTT